MQFSKEKWIAAYKQAVNDTKRPATSGANCALATLRYIRDGLCDDIGEKSEEDKAFCATIRECINEMIPQMQKDIAGFASNASAAGKAAGFKSENIFGDFVKE